MTNHDKPSSQGAEDSFVPNRKVPLLMTVVCGGLLAFNHYRAINDGQVSLWILFLGPLFFLLGVGGLIDPRIAWSLSGHNLPAKIKTMGVVFVVAGLVASAYLALGLYRLQEVRSAPSTESSMEAGSNQ